jgi:hypothetical protein
VTSTRPYAVVSVPVTTLWIAPDRPRNVDASIIRASPDAAAWLAAMDAHPEDDESGDGRLGLHGRVESQLVEGEPVVIVGTDDSGAWTEVRCPWQPSPKDSDGYPGWVPSAHLTPVTSRPGPPTPVEDPRGLEGGHPAVVLAGRHLGLPYLWGGLTPLGFDCSGLVHHIWRRLGIVVPRDAWVQAEFADPVPVGSVTEGDLYFFGRPGRRIHHVGIVVSPGRMVHASETGGILVEEDLTPGRVETLVCAGRLVTP